MNEFKRINQEKNVIPITETSFAIIVSIPDRERGEISTIIKVTKDSIPLVFARVDTYKFSIALKRRNKIR